MDVTTRHRAAETTAKSIRRAGRATFGNTRAAARVVWATRLISPDSDGSGGRWPSARCSSTASWRDPTAHPHITACARPPARHEGAGDAVATHFGAPIPAGIGIAGPALPDGLRRQTLKGSAFLMSAFPECPLHIRPAAFGQTQASEERDKLDYHVLIGPTN